jgi:hypothetical protein
VVLLLLVLKCVCVMCDGARVFAEEGGGREEEEVFFVLLFYLLFVVVLFLFPSPIDSFDFLQQQQPTMNKGKIYETMMMISIRARERVF